MPVRQHNQSQGLRGQEGLENVSASFVIRAGMRRGHPTVIEGENKIGGPEYSCAVLGT